MLSSEKPEIRALIVLRTHEGAFRTKLVASQEVKSWANWGWEFVAYDPADQEKLAQWMERELAG